MPSERLDIALVGCGVMGQRHLNGYRELEQAGVSNLRLVAVCDIDERAANSAADRAEALLGLRPQVVTDASELTAMTSAVDLVTEPATHHRIAVPLLDAGIHVLCEKPLALTARTCRLMLDAARRSGAVLGTAENYRRGPANRLARAVIDSGMLGVVHLMMQTSLGGSRDVVITPWRHERSRGAIGLDMVVHYVDVVEYLVGPVRDVYGSGRIIVAERRAADGSAVAATGEDALFAFMTTEAGAAVQMSFAAAGPGGSVWHRTVHGSEGQMVVPGDRSGNAVTVGLAGRRLAGDEIARELGFALDPVTQALFGGLEYDPASADAKHTAAELHDFADAVLTGRPPEVDGMGGARAVAATLAILESELLHRPVSVEEVLRGDACEYQASIDHELAPA